MVARVTSTIPTRIVRLDRENRPRFTASLAFIRVIFGWYPSESRAGCTSRSGDESRARALARKPNAFLGILQGEGCGDAFSDSISRINEHFFSESRARAYVPARGGLNRVTDLKVRLFPRSIIRSKILCAVSAILITEFLSLL